MKPAFSFIALLAGVPAAMAASLLTLTNPVADGAITTTAGNNDRSDWAGVTAFPADPNESLTTDFQAVSFAQDSTNFYLRQQMFATDAGGFLHNNQMLFLDTDQNRATGYLGPNGLFAVGGEYMLQGPTFYQYTGTGTDWSWTWLGPVTSYDDWPLNDHEMTFSRSTIGNPVAFDFIAATDFWGGGDAYPDTAHGGAPGGYYTYTTVPEPAAFLLLAMVPLLAARRRR